MRLNLDELLFGRMKKTTYTPKSRSFGRDYLSLLDITKLGYSATPRLQKMIPGLLTPTLQPMRQYAIEQLTERGRMPSQTAVHFDDPRTALS